MVFGRNKSKILISPSSAAAAAATAALGTVVQEKDNNNNNNNNNNNKDKTMAPSRKDNAPCGPVQEELRWGCDRALAERICNFGNRHHAEHSGYFLKTTFLNDVRSSLVGGGDFVFYDSNTGIPLFSAPRGRSLDDFMMESRNHGWPSFRDDEVNWDHVRFLPDGEVVSINGTHLGHNLPDEQGSRYCINLVSIAGRPIPKR